MGMFGNHHYHHNCGCGNSSSCGSCSTPTCGCKMNLSALCVVYQGSDLDTLGVTQGDRLEVILQKIDEYLLAGGSGGGVGFAAINVGNQVELYKGINQDDVAEFKTFRSTNSIEVSDATNTIGFEVSQSWIDAIIDPLKASITSIEGDIVNIETTLSTLQGNVSTNTSNISNILTRLGDLETEINSLNTTVNNLETTVNNLENAVTNNTTNITNNTDAINDLQVATGAVSVTEVFTEQFEGQQIVGLSKSPDEILNVFYEGGVLPKAGWVFQAPNQVALQLATYGLSIDKNDIVIVEYKK